LPVALGSVKAGLCKTKRKKGNGPRHPKNRHRWNFFRGEGGGGEDGSKPSPGKATIWGKNEGTAAQCNEGMLTPKSTGGGRVLKWGRDSVKAREGVKNSCGRQK